MYFGLPDDAVALKEGLREVLATACTPATIRSAWDGDPCDQLWKVLGEFGVPGLLVAEENGGLGLDELGFVAALEECGYAGVPGPVVETLTSLAVAPLPMDGSARVAVQALNGPTPHAAVSTHVLDLSGTLYELTKGAGEVTETVDRSRQLATFEGEALEIRLSDDDVALFERRGALGTAALLLGLARRQLDLTVGYVKTRQQFGAPIGSFQAIKHPLADAVVGTEFAWPAVLRAAQAIIDQDDDADLYVSMAKALASDAAYRMSRVCLQAHGAMGYTVEYDLHLFAKRTWSLSKDWGTASDHRELVAEHLGIRSDV
ncbi:MAG: acyl-CoA dehydrogenase [Frankiales bacterium]|nr:acyl-CoA dehydrogenase [Frankiales bacterium]